MFRKLLSNLPFNPSLINQVSFYAKRVHQEEGVRRSGMVLMVLALLLQLFAVVAPPEATLAGSSNDIIPGGFTKHATANEYCERNAYNFRNTLHRFDVDCNNLRAATTKTIRSTDYNRKLLSLGRLPYGKAGERPITGIFGEANPLYLRYLWSWDSGPYSTYKVLSGTNTKGAPFMVLYDCGNITVVETETPAAQPPPPAPPKKPNIEIIKKTTLPGTPKEGATVRSGDVLGYRIYFRNSGDAAATNVFVEDSTPTQTSFVKGSQGSGAADRYAYLDTPYPGSNGAEPHLYWAYYNFPAGANGYYVDFRVTVNRGVTDGQKICNTAFIRSNQTPQTRSNQICHIFKANAPKPEQTPVNVTPPGTPEAPVIAAPVKPCEKATDVNDAAACLELHKTATNDTQTIVDANNTTAKPGDVITYTLTTRNYGTLDVNDYVIKENLSDIMEYAEKVTDLNGGSMDNNTKIVSWPAVTIKAGQTVTKKISIKIKTDLPKTPSPPGNPGSYDLLMTNVYGDAINIKLPGSVATVVARANTTLPNTGPGTTVTVAVLITSLAAYFFSRSRLMGKELDIVREEYATSGGV